MFEKIKIGTHEVELAANAATPIRYASVFHEDPMKMFNEVQKNGADADASGLIMRLCFVMAMQAKRKDLSRVSEEDYITWLEDFEVMDFVDAANDIMAVYLGNKNMFSDPKKKDE